MIFFRFLMILACFLILSCTNENIEDIRTSRNLDTFPITIQHSMKGWELYSWPNGANWNFSILMGTNRMKTYEEIKSNKLTVSGLDSLKMILENFPQNEELFWIGKGWLNRSGFEHYNDFALPDNTIILEIEAFCMQKKLNLQISD